MSFPSSLSSLQSSSPPLLALVQIHGLLFRFLLLQFAVLMLVWFCKGLECVCESASVWIHVYTETHMWKAWRSIPGALLDYSHYFLRQCPSLSPAFTNCLDSWPARSGDLPVSTLPQHKVPNVHNTCLNKALWMDLKCSLCVQGTLLTESSTQTGHLHSYSHLKW